MIRRYVHAVALGCIPVFFVKSAACGRAVPLAEAPGESLAECSLSVYREDIPKLHTILAAVSRQEREDMRVRHLDLLLGAVLGWSLNTGFGLIRCEPGGFGLIRCEPGTQPFASRGHQHLDAYALQSVALSAGLFGSDLAAVHVLVHLWRLCRGRSDEGCLEQRVCYFPQTVAGLCGHKRCSRLDRATRVARWTRLSAPCVG